MVKQDIEDIEAELSQTEFNLASIIESFVELGVSIYDFPGTEESSQGMITNLKRNIERIKQLNQQSNNLDSQLQNIKIPLELLQYIEEGRNPDVYTRDFVEAIRRSNQYQRAKMYGLRRLRDSLAEKISEEFPELQPYVENILMRTNGDNR